MCGYHIVILRDGTIEAAIYGNKCRPLSRPGAHARGHNRRSFGVCMVGGVAEDGKTPENNFTAAQFESLERVLHSLLDVAPGSEILGHRDLPKVAKACPCFDVREWIAGLTERQLY